MFFPKHFFSLKSFRHKALWGEKDFVWSPLCSLENYFKKICYQIEIDLSKNIYLKDHETISIGKGTIIEPGVYIEGPCIIGENCKIGHGAFLRKNTILGDHCVIGHSAEVKRSILLNGASATHFTYVGDSILGNNVNLGAGVKCANLRLDREEIKISYKGEVFFTKLKKMGAIVGDETQVGCNCVLNPGTILGKAVLSYPLVDLCGVIPSYSRIKKAKEWHVFSEEKASFNLES